MRDLALWTVYWGMAGGWLVAATSAGEACELVAVDELIPYTELSGKAFAYEAEELIFAMRGFPQVLWGGLWREGTSHA